jgi:hypothetical protein
VLLTSSLSVVLIGGCGSYQPDLSTFALVTRSNQQDEIVNDFEESIEMRSPNNRNFF